MLKSLILTAALAAGFATAASAGVAPAPIGKADVVGEAAEGCGPG